VAVLSNPSLPLQRVETSDRICVRTFIRHATDTAFAERDLLRTFLHIPKTIK
jgi:hypothetical protein